MRTPFPLKLVVHAHLIPPRFPFSSFPPISFRLEKAREQAKRRESDRLPSSPAVPDNKQQMRSAHKREEWTVPFGRDKKRKERCYLLGNFQWMLLHINWKKWDWQRMSWGWNIFGMDKCDFTVLLVRKVDTMDKERMWSRAKMSLRVYEAHEIRQEAKFTHTHFLHYLRSYDV